MIRKALVFLLIVGSFNLALRVAPGLGGGIAHSISWLAFMKPLEDSWMPMGLAFERLHDASPLYDISLHAPTRFQYPPSSLLPYWILTKVGVSPTPDTLNLMGWCSVAVTIAVTFGVGVELASRLEAKTPDVRANKYAAPLVLALATFLFYPVMKAYTLGQIQTFLNALFAVACLLWLKGRRGMAGVCIGMICLVKPQLCLFGLWAALRKQRSFLTGFLLALGIGTLAAVCLFGLSNHLEYIKVMSYLSEHGEVFYPNQSFNGLLNRLVDGAASRDWPQLEFPPFNAAVHAGTMATSSVLIACALLFHWDSPERGSILDFMTAGLTFTMASPIAWEHHYGIMPSIYGALFFALAWASPHESRGRLLAGLAACFFLTSSYLKFTNALATTPLNFVQSYLLFGALGTLALLYHARTFPLDDDLVGQKSQGNSVAIWELLAQSRSQHRKRHRCAVSTQPV